MPSFIHNFKNVARRLLHTPLFTLVTIITLAVGIGANSAVFSIVNSILLKPLPFKDPERLVSIWYKAPGLGPGEYNQGPAFHLVYREENRIFEDIGLWRNIAVSVTELAEPERVDALNVTAGVLKVLAIQGVRGRVFSEADDSPGTPETVLLSYAYWQRRFGSDPGAIGRSITVDGRPREIIGVLPQDFRFLQYHPALFVPYRLNRGEIFLGNFSHQSIARLKPGITLAQASADIARMIPLAAKRFPMPPGFTLQMLDEARLAPSLHPLKQDVVGDVGKVLWVLLGTVGIVLLITCANVANLFLVRAENRQRELAIRAAMGAGWMRIARDLLAESVSLGIMGGMLGLFMAYAAIRFLIAQGPENIPRLEEITIDPVVLLFTAAISVLAGVLFGLIPVIKCGRTDLASFLKEGGRLFSDGRDKFRVRGALAIAQIALALVLLVGSGLMIRTLQAMKQIAPGFVSSEEVLTFRISIPATEAADIERAARIHEQILRRIEQVAGVTSVGLSSSITMDGRTGNDPIFVEDFPVLQDQIPPLRRYKYISPHYFATMGNPLLAGRDIAWQDIYNKAPVMIISETLAREYWKEPPKALGRRIRESPKAPWREIIGVVANEYDDGVNQKPTSVVYWPMLIDKYWGGQVFGQRTMAFAVRSSRVGVAGFFKEIQKAVWAVNINLPLAAVRSLKQIHEDSMARTSFTMAMLGIAAAVALLLSLVGIYGVVSYSVSQRTREIGVRMALGAQPAAVRALFLRHGFLLTSAGLVVGMAAGGALTRLMSALLFGISPLDLVTFTTVAAVLGLAAVLACYLPAQRASGVNPIEALRSE